MPLYEYRCSTCGGQFEVLQKFSDAPLTVHEGCGGPVERLLSAPGLHFKGSGWYITDYKNAGSKREGKAEGKSAEAKADGKSEGADSKPANGAKTESKPAAAAKSTE